METCIIVPSHINNINRTIMLIHCLQSLINQTVKIPIYLSISFGTELDKTLFNKLIAKNNLLNCILLCIIYQESQTSQFRHIETIINNIKDKYKYVMFCDDDDTYEPERVETFKCMIEYGFNNCPGDKLFVGVYETESHKGHSLRFYEYWSYCVNVDFIIKFINILKNNNFDYVFDNTMCDVLFSSYLRHLDNNHLFISVNEKLYNYNKNQYSITGQIKSSNDISNTIIKTKEPNFETFIQGLNELLEKNIESILNNIFVLYSYRKLTFEDILMKILKENYKYKNNINKNILNKLKLEYDNIKCLCGLLYQYK